MNQWDIILYRHYMPHTAIITTLPLFGTSHFDWYATVDKKQCTCPVSKDLTNRNLMHEAYFIVHGILIHRTSPL